MLIPQWQTKTPMRGSSPDILSAGIDLFRDQGAPRLGQQADDRRRGAAGLGYGLRNVLGILENPGHKDPRPGRTHRIQRRILAETETIGPDSQAFGQRA